MRLKYLIAIPTYHNHETWIHVLEGCIATVKFPIVIIDDGSHPPIEFSSHQDRVTVLRHEKNRGKGASIQTAIRYALQNNYTHLITIDADGQHDPRDIPALATAASEHPFDIVMGVRVFSPDQQVPLVSRFGRWFSNYWIKYQTGLRILDSQSGFRVYPLFTVQDHAYKYQRFEFELEVLIKCAWSGAKFIEIPVRTYYRASPFFPKNHVRVSHFDKFWDNVRITRMNFFMVVRTLFRLPLDLRGWCFGSVTLLILHFMSTYFAMPKFEGFEIKFLFLAAACFLTRINASFLLVGFIAQIFSPFALMSWIFVSLIFVSIRFWQSGRTKSTWTGRLRGGLIGHFILRNWARYAPRRLSYALMLLIVPYFYLSSPRARISSRAYSRRIFPEKNFVVRELLIFQHFYSFASVLVDRLHQSVGNDAEFDFENNGGEEILKSAGRPMGSVIVTAHFGALDVVAAAAHKFGLQNKIIRAAYVAPGGLNVEKELAKASSSHAGELPLVDQSRQSVLEMREWLRNGQSICLMGDRPLHKQYELIPFCGGLGLFDAVPFRLAQLSADEKGNRASLLFAFGIKKSPNRYCFFVRRCHHFEINNQCAMDESNITHEAMCAYATTLEELMKKNPMLWFNFFPFWSERPTPPELFKAKG